MRESAAAAGTPEPASEPTTGLMAYIRPYRWRLVQGFGLLLVTQCLDQAIPLLLGRSVDALQGGDLDRLTQLVVLVIACAVGMATVRTFSRVRVFYVARDIEFDLRNDLLAHLHRLGPTFFRRMPTGETMSRAINDLQQIRVMIGFGSLNVINTFFAYTIAFSLMLSISRELTLYALIPYPLLILASRAVGKMMYTRSTAAQEALGELATNVQETLSGIRIVRAFATEVQQRALFERANQNALARNMALAIIRGLMWPLLMGIGSLGTLIVLWRGTAMVSEDLLTIGELVTFLAFVEKLRWPTLGLGYIMAVLQRGRASYLRICEITDAVPEVTQAPDARTPGTEGALSIRHLSHSIGEHEILRDISLEVPAGQSLAIVGRTGSGKSTLAALLPRLLATPAGSVFLDGDDVTELDVSGLRRAVAYAQQDPFLFSDTIARNIGYSLDDPYSTESMQRIREAAGEASVRRDIEEFPEGFETVVGERGVQLSGGQKQRIALARALLHRPSVLVMDDPLSAVDAQTEASILQALERAARGRTVVLVTHRIAAAQRCDRIAVLDDGRVVEVGDHESLVASGGLYASMATRQQLEQELSSL